MHCYIIHNSVMTTSPFTTKLTAGINAYLDIEKYKKSDLKKISDEMWDHYKTTSGDYRCKDPLTTISILKDNNIHVLFSTTSSKTNVEVIEEVLDTYDFDPIYFYEDPGFITYKDEVNFKDFIEKM